jgi:hypothetical protein
MNQYSDQFLMWLESQVYDSHWRLDEDLFDFLVGQDQ